MFSQTVEYALRAMVCLAMAPSEMVPTTTLATQTRVPGNYLPKILQQLSAGGLVQGRRGVGGGYRLTRAAAEINLLDIINAVGTLKRIHTCPLGLEGHGSNLCPLHRALDSGAAAIIKIYDGVTLQNLVDDPRSPNRPLCEDRRVPVTVSGKGRGA